MQWGVKSAARPPRRAPVVIFYRHHDARPPQRAPRPARATDVIQPGGRVIHPAQHRPRAAGPLSGHCGFTREVIDGVKQLPGHLL